MPTASTLPRPPAPAAGTAVLTKAVLRAAHLLRMTNAELAAVVGVSPSVISRMGRHGGQLPMTSKTPELAALFLRFWRSLDAIVGGDDAVAAQWLRNENTALGARPIDLIKTVAGLTGALGYLDARRALV
jgi:uncharacterized protein (DUF2384 family)